ncbi:MAG: malate dehydrogenase (oxaloacetate-decarboxylating)(NADP+), partial [Thalassomonas sp.]
ARAKRNPKRVVFAEAEHYKILKAAQQVKDEGIAIPVLLGRKQKILDLIEEFSIEFDDLIIIDPKDLSQEKKREEYGDILWEKRKRKGLTQFEARKLMRERNYFGSMMVETRDADALISGISRNYRSTIKPALEVIGKQDDVSKVAGMYIMDTKKGTLFLADTTINANLSAEEIAEMSAMIAKSVKQFKIKPRLALLSYSNFGSTRTESSKKMAKAADIIREEYPNLIVDGEIQADFALDTEKTERIFPFSPLAEESANTLIFPNLESGNLAYKLIQEVAEVDSIGPVLVGMKKPVHILQLGCTVREIINMVTLSVVDAQIKK